MGTVVCSHASVARMLDELATVERLAGAILNFDDFLRGTEQSSEPFDAQRFI
jgi:pyrimidine oxygenase